MRPSYDIAGARFWLSFLMMGGSVCTLAHYFGSVLCSFFGARHRMESQAGSVNRLIPAPLICGKMHIPHDLDGVHVQLAASYHRTRSDGRGMTVAGQP